MENIADFCRKYLEKHIKTAQNLYKFTNDRSLMAKKLLSLQRGLTGSRTLIGSPYMQDDSLLAPYFLYYWPVSYTQMWCILWSVKDRILSLIESCANEKAPLTLTDLGSGPAPCAAAFCDMVDYLRGEKRVQIKVLLLDSSSKALTLAKKLFEVDFDSVSIKTQVCNMEKDFASGPILQEKNNVLLMSHALNELFAENGDREKICTHLLTNCTQMLTANGFFALSEPALLETSRFLIQVRNRLLKEGTVALLSPCPGNADCPVLLEKNHTCHGDFLWTPPKPVSSLAEEAGLDRHSVKMSYFVFALHDKAQADEDGTFMVTSDPMLNKAGRVRYLLCNGKKRIAFSAKKDDPHAREQGFFNLRRYDIIRIENPEIRESGALGFAKDTKLVYTNYNG